MPDTSILNTLALVRTAKNAVSDAQSDKAVKGAQQTLLVKMLWQLDDLEGALILNDIQDQVGKLTADSSALQGVTSQLQTSIASLQAVADDVNQAAKAIGLLVQVAQAAAAIAAL